MAITTRDGLIAALAASSSISFTKASSSSTVGFTTSLFRIAGSPALAAAPTTAAGGALDRTSPGAMSIPAPSGTSYITTFSGVSTSAGCLLMADRLVETGALSGVVTTAQTVGSVALPTRATGALDVELWLEVYTAMGSTACPTVTASYTNQSGTAGQTATLVGGIPITGTLVNRSYRMALQSGDTGVQSVQSVTLGTSTSTAGAFGVVLRRSLLFGMMPVSGVGFTQGYAETGMEKLPDDACVELLMLTSTTITGVIVGSFGVSQG